MQGQLRLYGSNHFLEQLIYPLIQSVIDAYKEIGNIPVPIIVRLQGTNAVEAKKLIDESGLKVYSAILLKEAATLVTKVLEEK